MNYNRERQRRAIKDMQILAENLRVWSDALAAELAVALDVLRRISEFEGLHPMAEVGAGHTLLVVPDSLLVEIQEIMKGLDDEMENWWSKMKDDLERR